MTVTRSQRAALYARILMTWTRGQAALDLASESIIITSSELEQPGPKIVYVNTAFCRMCGYGVEELIGRTPRLLQGVRTDRAETARLRSDLEAHGRAEGEIINYKKNGREYVTSWAIAPLRASTGEVVGWLSVQDNISDLILRLGERPLIQ